MLRFLDVFEPNLGHARVMYRIIEPHNNTFFCSDWVSEIDRISFVCEKFHTNIASDVIEGETTYDISDCHNHLDIIKKHPHIFL